MGMVQIISNLTVGEQCALFKTVESFYESHPEIAENAKLKEFFSSLFEKNEAVIKASNKIDTSQKLDKADYERDDAVRKFFVVVEGGTAQVDEAEAAEAEKVLAVLNNYGRKMTALSFSEETTKIESLLKDLEQSETAQALKAVHGGEASKERLRKAQDAFLALYAEKSTSQTASSAEKSACEQKKALRDFYNQSILPYLQALCVLEGEKYEPFVSELNAEISRVNASSRKSLKQSKQLS